MFFRVFFLPTFSELDSDEIELLLAEIVRLRDIKIPSMGKNYTKFLHISAELRRCDYSLLIAPRLSSNVKLISNISTTSARVLSGVPNTEKQMKARGRFGRVLLLFQGVWNA